MTLRRWFQLLFLSMVALLTTTRYVVAAPGPAGGGQATPAEALEVRPGFRVELLRSAKAGEGSWISMTRDDRGRWYFARDSRGVVRVTPAADGASVQVEIVDDTLEHCRGLLYAYDSLYVSATNSQGFYRLRDTTGDDVFDEVRLLRELRYKSRFGHGPNQVALGPDGMLYIVIGNDVFLPDGVSPNSPYRGTRDDLLLPNPQDASDERVGCILRTDPEGITWEVIAGGFRNPFDVAFHPDGEMFTFDADMEWDIGLPWYRPIRVNHVISGADYGWRWGTGKWPAHSPDSLPSTLDVGMGSPTGLAFGTRSRFPERYRRGLFMGEWQNGRILLVDLTPQGSTYTGAVESFIEGGPLNVCDLEFGLDGALYFITGGRRSQSGFYRVTYEASEAVVLPPRQTNNDQEREAARARASRRKLETYHMLRDPAAIDLAWLSLGSPDTYLRHAARLALERQDTSLWRRRVLHEENVAVLLTALLALARAGQQEDRTAIFERLGRISLAGLSRAHLLLALRVYALSFVRHGAPDEVLRTAVLAHIDPLFPHVSSWVNQELCALLVYLRAPRVVERTIRLLSAAAGSEEQIHYATTLTHAVGGWTTGARRAVFDWLVRARRFRGGKWLGEHIATLVNSYRDALNEQEKHALRDVVAVLEKAPARDGTRARSMERTTVKHWQPVDLTAHLSILSSGRSHAAGKKVFREAGCLECHRRGEEGRATGPDLTQVGRRFDAPGVLASILEPSAVVDPKYRLMTYVMDDGRVITGRAAGVGAERITVEVDPLSGESEVVERARIATSAPSELSPMPEGLLDAFTREEILDLIAYLRADIVP